MSMVDFQLLGLNTLKNNKNSSSKYYLGKFEMFLLMNISFMGWNFKSFQGPDSKYSREACRCIGRYILLEAGARETTWSNPGCGQNGTFVASLLLHWLFYQKIYPWWSAPPQIQWDDGARGCELKTQKPKSLTFLLLR